MKIFRSPIDRHDAAEFPGGMYQIRQGSYLGQAGRELDLNQLSNGKSHAAYVDAALYSSDKRFSKKDPTCKRSRFTTYDLTFAVSKAYFLATPWKSLKFNKDAEGVIVQLPPQVVDPIATVVVLETK